jgi:hypothetical protein
MHNLKARLYLAGTASITALAMLPEMASAAWRMGP